jgi:hypothetical protein
MFYSFISAGLELVWAPMEHAQFGVRKAVSFSTNKVLQALPYLKLRFGMFYKEMVFACLHLPF